MLNPLIAHGRLSVADTTWLRPGEDVVIGTKSGTIGSLARHVDVKTLCGCPCALVCEHVLKRWCGFGCRLRYAV